MSKPSDERYTPKWLHQPIIDALGGYCSLDPTANEDRSFPAAWHFTKEDDCFTRVWNVDKKDTTIYMNPPYSNSHFFLERLVRELPKIKGAITLTLSGVLSNKKTQPLIKQHAAAIVHPHGRIQFVDALGNPIGKSNDRDVVFICWGEADADVLAGAINGMVCY